MSEYQPGDIVDIAIKGVRVHGADYREYGRSIIVLIPTGDGRTAMTRVWPQLPSVTVEIVEPAPPAEWPPRRKDLWRDKTGELWFAVDVSNPHHGDAPYIVFVPSYDADNYDAEQIRKIGSPLTLVHREDGAE